MRVYFFSFFHEYAIHCGIVWRQTFQECFQFITFQYSNCCILRVKMMQNNSETDTNKSAQYKVTTLQMAFTYDRKSLKRSYHFLKYTYTCVFALRVLRPCEFHSNSDKKYTYILNWWIVPFPCILYHSMDSLHKFPNTQYFFLK